MIQLEKQFAKETLEMRQAYAQSLIKAAETDDRILTIYCDLASSMGTGPFSKAFPNQSNNQLSRVTSQKRKISTPRRKREISFWICSLQH